MRQRDLEKDILVRLWDEILFRKYGPDFKRKDPTRFEDPEADTFLWLLRLTFYSFSWGQRMATVDPKLIEGLAMYAGELHSDHPQVGGPFGNRSNDIVFGMYKGLVSTFRHAIESGTATYRKDGHVWFGGFEIPNWFVDECTDKLHTKADDLDKLWKDSAPRERYIQRRRKLRTS